MAILGSAVILTGTVGSMMLRGMQNSVGRTWQGERCANDNLDVFWVQVMLNNLISSGEIPTLTHTDAVPINGEIDLAESVTSAGSTVRAINAIQTYKLKQQFPTGQIQPDDSTHKILSSWKRPIAPEVRFNALQAAALSSFEWNATARDVQMKAVLKILVSSKDPDDQYLHWGTVRAYMENQPGATLFASSLLRVLREKFDDDPSISPVGWVKALRTIHTREILKGIVQLGSTATNENGSHPWKSSPAIDNKKNATQWVIAKAQDKNSIYYPFRYNIGVDSTWGVIETLDELE